MPSPGRSGYRRKCPGCFYFFVICQSCHRGQRYCSYECRYGGRLATFRRGSQTYQRSPIGRIKHRERQKKYRKNRQLKKIVTQHSLKKLKKTLPLVPGAGSVFRSRIPVRSLSGGDNRCCRSCQKPVGWFLNSS